MSSQRSVHHGSTVANRTMSLRDRESEVGVFFGPNGTGTVANLCC